MNPLTFPLAIGLGSIGLQEILIILAVFMVLFGYKKLPGMGRSLGGALRGLKEGLLGLNEELEEELGKVDETTREGLKAVTKEAKKTRDKQKDVRAMLGKKPADPQETGWFDRFKKDKVPDHRK